MEPRVLDTTAPTAVCTTEAAAFSTPLKLGADKFGIFVVISGIVIFHRDQGRRRLLL
jgi:hypothetical protein